MGVTAIKTEIETCEASIRALQQSFSVQRQQIVEAIKPFVKAQIKKEVENEVKRNSEHTKGLGKEALSEMKKRLAELLDNSDNITDSTFSDDALWTYVNYRVSLDGDRYGQKYNNRKDAKENIIKCIKIIIGEAGQLLIDNEYIEEGGLYRRERGMRYDYTKADKGSTKLMYGYALTLPQDIENLIGEYGKSIEDLHDATDKVLNLQKKLSEQEAVDLWDEV